MEERKMVEKNERVNGNDKTISQNQSFLDSAVKIGVGLTTAVVMGYCALTGQAAQADDKKTNNTTEIESIVETMSSYIEQNAEAMFVNEVFPNLRYEAVSADDPDLNKMKRWDNQRKEKRDALVKVFKSYGCENIQVFDLVKKEKDGKVDTINSINHGNYAFFCEIASPNPNAKTFLFYNHADVQSADRSDKAWLNDPFNPEKFFDTEITVNGKKVNDKIAYGRGVIDDTGQLFMHLFALKTLKAYGIDLPINMKFLIEMGEEMGSPLMREFLQGHKDMLKAEGVIIADGDNGTYENMDIITSLRGITTLDVKVKTFYTENDSCTHSGSVGGVLPNAPEWIAKIAAGLKDINGIATVASFYDGIVVPDSLREMINNGKKEGSKRGKVEKMLPFKKLGDTNKDIDERICAMPSLEVHVIHGGEFGTKLCPTASMYITSRIAYGQDAEKIGNSIKEKVEQLAREYGMPIARTPQEIGIYAEVKEVAQPFYSESSSPVFKAVVDGLKAGTGVKAVNYTCHGATEPIASHFGESLGVPVINMGYGNPNSNAHGKNENILLHQDVIRGIKGMIGMYFSLSKK